MNRFILWTVVAVLCVAATRALGLQFERKLIEEMFRAKLTFLGLVVTLSAFQYGVWRTIILRTLEALREMRQDRTLGPAARDKAVKEIGSVTMEVIDHNEALLLDLFAVGAGLLLSVSVDLLMFLSYGSGVQARVEYPAAVVSTGLFAFCLLPFFGIGGR